MSCPLCGYDAGPVLADLCSGAGGAGYGYGLAGFHVVGFDIRPQPRYPFEFVQADALAVSLDGFDAAHASPPCEDHMRRSMLRRADHGTGWLLAAFRERLAAWGGPWVLENVPGAPLRPDFKLCGCMFGLEIDAGILVRERWFETSWAGFDLRPPCQHRKRAISVVGHGEPGANRVPGRPVTEADRRRLMGVPWMTQADIGDAIPPEYARYMGGYLRARLTGEDTVAS